jgi:hypothetical protein
VVVERNVANVRWWRRGGVVEKEFYWVLMIGSTFERVVLCEATSERLRLGC